MIQSPTSRRTYYEVAMPARSGEMLFLEGDPSEYVYELRRGIARGVTISSDGERHVTAFFFAGDQIGLPVCERYRFTAEAVTDLHYVRQSRHAWNESLIRICRDEGRLLPAIGAEQDPSYRRGLIIARTSILSRLCAFLQAFYERLPKGEGETRVLALPQIDIAAYLATSPESVCRQLRQLREAQVIAMPQRDLFRIVDAPRLCAFAAGARTQL